MGAFLLFFLKSNTTGNFHFLITSSQGLINDIFVDVTVDTHKGRILDESLTSAQMKLTKKKPFDENTYGCLPDFIFHDRVNIALKTFLS